jgi:DNA polymerase-3 subunit gamma/tau
VVAGLVDALADADLAAALGHIGEALDQGVDPRQLQARLLEYLRQLLSLALGMDAGELDLPEEALARLRSQAQRLSVAAVAGALRKVNDARPSPDRSQPALPLELALVESILATSGPAAAVPEPAGVIPDHRSPAAGAPVAAPQVTTNPTVSTASAAGPDKPPPVAAPQVTTNPTVSTAFAAGPDKPPPAAETAAPRPGRPPSGPPGAAAAPAGRRVAGGGPELGRLAERWPEVLAEVARTDKSTAALLRDGRPVAVDEATVTVGFFYQFHCDRVSDPQRSGLVRSAIAGVLGGERQLLCTVVPASPAEDADRPRNKADQARADPVIRHAVENLGAEITGVDRGGS